MKHRSYVLASTAVLGVFWSWLAIDPLHRDDWLLENALFVLACTHASRSHLPIDAFVLTNSYTLMFVFLVLHTIRAHYTYAEVLRRVDAGHVRVFAQ